ncbi:polyhydroxyalkanoate depolymerase [Roseovarius sp. M141]|uniref:polyhydroxyalkanoate depolymerase n=1 Tax=Roseovarius sp. M141 TaxID=2583806 RepID=UPI0020CF51D1|nr:polyhydroxyalkanoate depolymerase [Roseovarius sp. M141]
MRYMATYDMMETMRNANQWLGATALSFASYPIFSMTPNPAFQWISAWGEVTERTFDRMVKKPDWGIRTFTCDDGRDHLVSIDTIVEKPFGNLIQFAVPGRKPMKRRVLLIAPMSGHYATLLRSTVKSLLVHCEVFITDWHNARDIPVSAGKFDVEDYTLYLTEFMREMGPDTHVIAVCQPVPLALAATALLAEDEPEAQPRSLTLIGGPVDPDANPTEVTDFGRRVTMGQLGETMTQRVGFKYPGVGRMVYPGLLQLSSFISMNSEKHAKAFSEQIARVAKGEGGDYDRHNRFYDEYLSVMDMPAEFYLSTVERIFKGLEIANNEFTINGRRVDIGKITTVAVKTVEGGQDDISAPGQCIAALDLLTGLPDSKKASHVEPDAGHYGIFAGRSWRNNIRPLVLDFIDRNSGPDAPAPKDEVPKAANADAAMKVTAAQDAQAKDEAPKAANADAAMKVTAAQDAQGKGKYRSKSGAKSKFNGKTAGRSGR